MNASTGSNGWVAYRCRKWSNGSTSLNENGRFLTIPHLPAKIERMDTPNPVVLLSNNVWHIVEYSRRSSQAICGKRLHERQAHSRLTTIGKKNCCPKCLALFTQTNKV
ncbi:MAG: hypothetical protein GY943_34720 [Chloroflexi bacterium]|nr:hypothetical protein [Chloroflexota bacterium]